MNAVAQRCAFNLTSSSSDASSHKAIVAAKKAYFRENKGGMIVKNTMVKNCIEIDFYGPAGSDGKSIEVEMFNCANMQRARACLLGETYNVVHLSQAEFEELRGILAGIARTTGRVDAATGCQIFEAVLP